MKVLPESDELSEEELESSLESSELEDSFDFFDLVDFVEPCRDFIASVSSTSSIVFSSLKPNWTVLEQIQWVMIYESQIMTHLAPRFNIPPFDAVRSFGFDWIKSES